MEIIERIIEEQNLLDNKILAIRLDSFEADKNLTGLIANQLMSKYQRPVLLLNKVINEEIEVSDIYGTVVTTIPIISWEGSGRGYDKSKFDNLREFLKESGLVMFAEGHANALGVGIYDTFFDSFIEYSNQALAEFDFTPCYKVDFIHNGNNFSGYDVIEIAELKSIWGQGVEEPLIAFENINIHKNNIELMAKDRNPTLKITLPNGTSLIKFKSSNEEYEKLISSSNLGCMTINVVGRCERNIWNGIVKPQIIIEDYEIIGEQEYYF